MAIIEFKGGDIQANLYRRLARSSEESVKKAIKAGSKILVKNLQDAAPVRTGGLRDSIKAEPIKYDAGNGYHCMVHPTGNHPDTGEPYAKIANILEYGRSYGATKKPPIPWFHTTVEQSEDEVNRVMQEELDKAVAELVK